MSDIELGPGKRARAAYSFDEIAIVPSRRTRDLEEVSISWQIDAYKFELPFISAPMDSVVSPETAIAIGEAGGLGVLNLEGIWTRYEDAQKQLSDMAKLSEDKLVAVPRNKIIALIRSLFRFFPIHKIYHSVELSIIFLLAAIFDFLSETLILLTWAAAITVIGHLVAILTSSRLRA